MDVKKIQAALQQAVEKFDELDDDMEIPLDKISHWLWIPWASLVIIGVFFICYQIWWLPFFAVAGVIVWNVVAMLSFKKPPLIMPPKPNFDSLVVKPFHFISKSKRVLFLMIPFFSLALVRGLQATLLAWLIALAFLWLLRFALKYDKWVSEKYFEDKDYFALGLASLIGFICFFYVHPGKDPAIVQRKDQQVQAKKEVQEKQQTLENLETSQIGFQERLAAMEKNSEAVKVLRQKLAQSENRMAQLEKENETLKSRTAKIERTSKALKSIDSIKLRLTKLEDQSALNAMREMQKSVLVRVQALEQKSESLPAIRQKLIALESVKLKSIDENLKQLENVSQDLQHLQTRTAILEEDNNTRKSADTLARISTIEDEVKSMKSMTNIVPDIQNRILALESKTKSAGNENRLKKLEDDTRELKLLSGSLQDLQSRIAMAEGHLAGMRNNDLKLLEGKLETLQARISTLESQNQTLALMKEALANRGGISENDRKTLENLQAQQKKIKTDLSVLEEEKKNIQLLQQVQMKTQMSVSDLQRDINEIKQRLDTLEQK